MFRRKSREGFLKWGILALAIAIAAAFPAAAFAGKPGLEPDALLTAQAVNVSNPRVVADSSMECGQLSTWDCVWFGSYPQTEVASSDSVYASLQSASWDANGDATVGDARYRRISRQDASSSDNWPGDSGTYRYFRYEPVKWRVLSVSGNTAYVVADVALDNRQYNSNYVSVSWDTSSIRSWLNGYGASYNQPRTSFTSSNFIGAAFSSAEQSAIVPASAVNNDKVLLLSHFEVSGDAASAYGFSKDVRPDFSKNANASWTFEDRMCKCSDFADAMGAGRNDDGFVYWWIRWGRKDYSWQATAHVADLGRVYENLGTGPVDWYSAIRPSLNLDLSSPYVTYAGMVSSNGVVDLTPSSASRFTDVGYGSSHPHWVIDDGGSDWLSAAVDAGLMGGYYGTALFGPDDPITRGQVATVLYRASVADASDTANPGRYADNATPFSDAPGGRYYTAAMNWAFAEGVFTGDAGGVTVRPDDGITRQELALVLYRYATANGGPALADASCFSGAPDAADVPGWASAGVAWCYENGIMTGDSSTRALTPGGGATRAAMCKMAVATLGLLGRAE